MQKAKKQADESGQTHAGYADQGEKHQRQCR